LHRFTTSENIAKKVSGGYFLTHTVYSFIKKIDKPQFKGNMQVVRLLYVK